jgi:DNA-binding LytR/AlgR family response regulator
MKALIIEDEPLNAERLQKLLLEVRPSAKVLAILDSVRSAVNWFDTHPSPDLVFMDIQLADGLSFDIFDRVALSAPVIFTTAYQEYAIKAFKVHSVDYLLKPIQRKDLQAALEKYGRYFGGSPDPGTALDAGLLGQIRQMLKGDYKSRFLVRVGDHIRSIDVADVLYFFSMEKGTYLHTSEHRNYVIDYTLDALSEILDPDLFFRINRKYISSVVAIEDLVHLSGTKIKVSLSASGDDQIYVSRDRIPAFKAWLDR